jgi:predicted phosphodiesterase
MRTAIISDIHSNLEALEATLQDIAAHNVGCVLCLGDLNRIQFENHGFGLGLAAGVPI